MNATLRATTRALIWTAAPMLLASMLISACGGDEGAVATDTTTPTVEAADEDGSPTPGATPTSPAEGGGTTAEAFACAADSTAQFRDADAEAPWPVYCPLYLPDGFQLESIDHGLDVAGAAPEAGVGALEARFVNPETGTRVVLVQGQPGLSALTSGVRSGDELGALAYGDLSASLFASDPAAPDAPFLAVMADPLPSGTTHWLQTIGLSEEDTRAIAEGMSRVDALP